MKLTDTQAAVLAAAAAHTDGAILRCPRTFAEAPSPRSSMP